MFMRDVLEYSLDAAGILLMVVQVGEFFSYFLFSSVWCYKVQLLHKVSQLRIGLSLGPNFTDKSIVFSTVGYRNVFFINIRMNKVVTFTAVESRLIIVFFSVIGKTHRTEEFFSTFFTADVGCLCMF